MGVTTIKRKFNISHIVEKVENEILISSPYIHGLIKIKMDGSVSRDGALSSGSGFRNKDLDRYWNELKECSKEELSELFNAPEILINPMVIYTASDRKVIKTFCKFIPEGENLYPNVDINGILMYENSHFRKRTSAKKHLKRESVGWVKVGIERLKNDLQDLSKSLVLFLKRLFNFIYIHITY